MDQFYYPPIVGSSLQESGRFWRLKTAKNKTFPLKLAYFFIAFHLFSMATAENNSFFTARKNAEIKVIFDSPYFRQPKKPLKILFSAANKTTKIMFSYFQQPENPAENNKIIKYFFIFSLFFSGRQK
jgi:hypothetical protein